jgi:hypothetical protein
VAIREGLDRWADIFRQLQEPECEVAQEASSEGADASLGREMLLGDVRGLLRPPAQPALPEVELV